MGCRTAWGAIHRGRGREWHRRPRWKTLAARVEGALASLHRLGGGEDAEVQRHTYKRYSDENLKQAIAEVENALAALRTLDGDDAEVQGHGYKWSDEDLKEAVTSLSDALEALKAIDTQRRS